MKRLFLLLLLGLWHLSASSAPLTIEITRGGSGASPIAIVPFGWVGGGAGPDQDIAQIVRDDLLRSGRFQTMPVKDMLQMPQTQQEVRFEDWRIVRMDSLVIGQVVPEGRDGYMVRFQLFDVSTGESLAGYKIPTSQKDLRITAHRIADIIYEKLTGQRGAFATRIAYVTSTDEKDGEQRVSLNVADADGFNSQTIVTSKKPLMSPAWSPDGSRLAYVSFEKGQPAIYVQDIYSGKRSRVAAFPGINGAPAWAPDGRKLAVTLSKDGNPDIYVLDIASGSVNPIVRHSAIDTEPAWSPDGRWIIFTSDRGGGPQIYKIPSSGGSAQRVTFEGNYNARASYAPDGKSITLLTRENGSFRIGVLDLASGSMQTLSDGPLDESPSFAPNGAMIIYATKINNKGELSAVSVDGRVRQRLALQVGDVREPVWSPFSGSK